jgi:type III secretion system-like peptide-binding chaperone
MEFKSEAQKACYEKVVPWMKEVFGEFIRVREDMPIIAVFVGSAIAQVAVFAWGDNDATITTRAYVVTGADTSQKDLLEYLLRESADMRFGAFGIDQEGDILFQHAIVGSKADKDELKASVMAVVLTADDYDDKIVSRWGGQRALDKY